MFRHAGVVTTFIGTEDHIGPIIVHTANALISASEDTAGQVETL